MQQFTYIIQDSLGIHARPAGLLVKEAQQYPDTTLTLTKDGKSAKLNQLMRLLSLGVKQGDTVTLTAEGPAEAQAVAALQEFFKENL